MLDLVVMVMEVEMDELKLNLVMCYVRLNLAVACEEDEMDVSETTGQWPTSGTGFKVNRILLEWLRSSIPSDKYMLKLHIFSPFPNQNRNVTLLNKKLLKVNVTHEFISNRRK